MGKTLVPDGDYSAPDGRGVKCIDILNARLDMPMPGDRLVALTYIIDNYNKLIKKELNRTFMQVYTLDTDSRKVDLSERVLLKNGNVMSDLEIVL